MKTTFLKLSLVAALVLSACGDLQKGYTDTTTREDRGINESAASTTLRCTVRADGTLKVDESNSDDSFPCQ